MCYYTYVTDNVKMNLILRTHENFNDPVWGVIWMILIALLGTGYYIFYLMKMADDELTDEEKQGRH